MSITLMSAIFENTKLRPTERLVMLALADHADVNGRCYPSILRLCQRTGLSERAVQTNTKKLVAAGYLSISIGGGKGNANLYLVRANPAGSAPYRPPEPRTKCNPHQMHPALDAPQTPHVVRSNPAPDAPETSGTAIVTVTEAAAERARQNSGDLVADLIHALGFDRGGKIPTYWGAPDASLIVARWQSDLHLTRDEIIGIAQRNSVQHGSANGPKVLIRHMQSFAAAKAAPPLAPTASPTGARHAKTSRADFDTAHREYTRRLAAGEIQLRPDPSDPFAKRN